MKPLNIGILVLAFATAAAAPSPSGSAPSDSAAPVSLGNADQAHWTETTQAAAATPANKEWLARGKTATLTGEVVDVSCYLQLGKRGPAHVDCGRKCVSAGQPGGLLDADGNLYLLLPEQHHPRRDGQVSLRTWIASNMGAQATITGVLAQDGKGRSALFVQAPPSDASPLPETIPHTTPAAAAVPPPHADASASPAAPTPPTTSPLPSASPSPVPDIVPAAK